jgi:hypothetical protein
VKNEKGLTAMREKERFDGRSDGFKGVSFVGRGREIKRCPRQLTSFFID